VKRAACLVGLSAIMVVLVAATGGGSSPGQAPRVRFESYAFVSAAGDTVAAELGRVTVPEDWERRNGRQIELELVRFRATVPNPGPPIVYLAGGPGGSGTATARGPRFPVFMALRQVADVIALDQRGTGGSKPSTLCSQPWTYPVGPPGLPEEILQSMRAHSRSCAEELGRAEVDLAAYHTNNNADDLDALRQALGVERVSLWAISYGTHLALATLRRHGTAIHRVILAGVEGPDHTLKLPSAIEAEMLRIDSLVRQDTAWRRVMPDFAGTVRSVLGQLRATPATVTVRDAKSGQSVAVAVSAFDVQRLTVCRLGRRRVDSAAPLVLLPDVAGRLLGGWSTRAPRTERPAISRDGVYDGLRVGSLAGAPRADRP